MHATLPLLQTSDFPELRCTHLTELMYLDIDGISIEVADHCYGCTAGQGSGCNGAFGALDIEAGGQV